MKNSLLNKINSIKSSLYIPIAAAALAFASYTPLYSQSRTTESETFTNNTITRSYIAQHPEKWRAANNRLEADDLGTRSGFTRFHFNDKLYNLQNTNMSLEVTLDKSEWGSDVDLVGMIFCGDPTQGDNGTYYRFNINAYQAPGQFSLERITPGISLQYIRGTSNLINIGSSNKLKVEYNATGYHFYINDTELTEVSTAANNHLPSVEGYVGIMLLDSRFNDSFTATTYYDDFIITYDSGGGGGGKIKENKLAQKGQGGGLQPHIPDIFLRGDSNMDGVFNIADPIHTLNYLFKQGPPPECMDAADTNDDGYVDLSDAVTSLLAQFRDLRIQPPHIGGPGMDLTYERLRCERGLVLE
jgi:hypothetical protein